MQTVMAMTTATPMKEMTVVHNTNEKQVVAYIQKFIDEILRKLRHKCWHIKTAREGPSEGVPRVAWHRLKRRVAGQHLKDKHSQRPVICSFVGALAADDFGRLIVGCSADCERQSAVDLFGEAKVSQADVSLI